MAQYSPFAQRAIEQKTGMSFAEYQANKAAKDAGFANAADQTLNRILRNQIEQEIRGKGYTDFNAIYSEAQKAAGGGPLTSNETLQNMYGYVAGMDPYAPPKPPEEKIEEVKKPEPPPENAKVEEPIVETESDVAVKEIDEKIKEDTFDFENALANQANMFRNLMEAQQNTLLDVFGADREQREAERAEQDKRMTSLQNMFIAQQQQRDRPAVIGVKTATGKAGDAMQIARRGVSGTFGRRGMRISSLNV